MARLTEAVFFGTTLTIAVEVLDESRVDTACTFAVSVPEIELGAVYKPVGETVPSDELPLGVPFTFHVTEEWLVPVTLTLNCCVPPGFRVADIGDTLTEVGLDDPPQEAASSKRRIMKAALVEREYLIPSSAV